MENPIDKQKSLANYILIGLSDGSNKPNLIQLNLKFAPDNDNFDNWHLIWHIIIFEIS